MLALVYNAIFFYDLKYYFQILYFKDFSPCSISQSSLNGLTSIQWKSYGLTLKSIADQDGCASLEWENLPPYTDINIALHCYHKQQYPSVFLILHEKLRFVCTFLWS